MKVWHRRRSDDGPPQRAPRTLSRSKLGLCGWRSGEDSCPNHRFRVSCSFERKDSRPRFLSCSVSLELWAALCWYETEQNPVSRDCVTWVELVKRISGPEITPRCSGLPFVTSPLVFVREDFLTHFGKWSCRVRAETQEVRCCLLGSCWAAIAFVVGHPSVSPEQLLIFGHFGAGSFVLDDFGLL